MPMYRRKENKSGQEDKPRTTKTKPEIDAEGKRLVDSGDIHPDTFAQEMCRQATTHICRRRKCLNLS
jgi:hypothetical protein